MLLASMLLDSGKHADALAAYEAALKIAPHRFNSVAGAARAAQLSGDYTKARAYYLDLARLGEHAEAPRPELSQARAYLEKN
jgi:tetratricopeptide (TPR) repeat protein